MASRVAVALEKSVETWSGAGSTVARSTISGSVLVVTIIAVSIATSRRSSCPRCSGLASTIAVLLVVGLSTAAGTRPRWRSSRVASTTVVTIVASPRSSPASGTTLPWLKSALATSVAAAAATVAVLDSSTGLPTTTAHFGHKSIQLALGCPANATLVAIVSEAIVVVAPGLTDLALWTITSHMTSLSTDAADDAGSEVLLLWAVVFAVTDFTAILTSLVLVVTKGTVEGSKFTKLVSLQFVLTLGDGGSLKV